jgi:RNA polymerase sigma-70 factor, ECF subfamily
MRSGQQAGSNDCGVAVTMGGLATNDHMDVTDRDSHWEELMRAANSGDAAAYRRLLETIAPVLRSVIRRGLGRAGLAVSDVEDVLQETLLAIHLKRHTWRESEPFTPWVRAIARNKLIDALRRRGRSAAVPIDDFLETLAAPEDERRLSAVEADKMLGMINGRSREVVQAMALEGLSTREAATRLGLSEGAVRVALHRGLNALARALKDRER